MPTFEELSAENPNIRALYDEWRADRAERGEDATDYVAFRSYVMDTGGPDPGEAEITDFVGEEFKAAHPERYG